MSLNYELSLLRNMYQNPQIIPSVMQKVSPEMLNNGVMPIYMVMRDLVLKGVEVTQYTVRDELYKYILSKENTEQYMQMLQAEPEGSWETDVKYIVENYMRKKIMEEAETLKKMARRKEEVAVISGKVIDLINTISVLDNGEDTDEDLLKDDIIEFPYDFLKKLGYGLARGEIISIGAEAGHGKSTFSIWLANGLIEKGYKVLIVSVEMRKKQVLQKLISMRTKIDSYKITREQRLLTDEERERINKEYELIKEKYLNTNILTIKESMTEVSEIAMEMIKLKPDVMIIDWIQMMDMPDDISSQNMAQGIPKIFKIIKKISKRIRTATIAVGQLEIRGRTNKRPTINDFTDSTAFKKYSSDIYLLFRPLQAYNYTKLKNVMEIRYVKSRFGLIKDMLVEFTPEYGIISPLIDMDLKKEYMKIVNI